MIDGAKYCVLGMLLSTLLSACAGTGGAEFAGRIFVPDAWDPPEVANQNGRIFIKPSTPTDFKEQRVGTFLGIKSVTVHGESGRTQLKRLGAPTEIQLEDSTILTVVQGRDVKIDKKYFKVLGTANGLLYLQERKSKKIWRFSSIPKADAKSTLKEGDDPKNWQFMVR